MNRIAYLLVIVAATSTAAVAKESKKSATPTVTANQMTDAEMDRVTAGLYFVNGNGQTVNNPGQGTMPGTTCYCAPGIGRSLSTPAADTSQGARYSP